MTYAKKEVFSEKQQILADIAKALSHPARIAIIEYLAKQKNCFSGDITDEIPLGRTTVSQHLQELRRVGIIQGTIEGTKVNYCIDPKVLHNYHKLFQGFFSKSLLKKCCKV
jgi:ArsR family transcriptional regulator, arsenate/arsenite/antimonite-responsive transcriptional repressor